MPCFMAEPTDRLLEPQQRVVLLAGSQDHDGFTGQLGGCQPRIDTFDSAIVDVSTALLRGAAGVAFAFREAGGDEGVDDRAGRRCP